MPLVPVGSQIECFNQRSDVIKWLISVVDDFSFCDETLFHAVDIFDRFLRRIRTPSKYLRCIAITCLYLAAKFNEEEELVPVTGLLIERSCCGCSESEVLRMELCILNKLNWALIASPTPLQFIHLFEALIRLKCPSSLNGSLPDSAVGGTSTVLTHALIQCLPQLDLIQCSPSVIALSLLSLYLQMTWIYWLPAVQTLQAHAQITDVKLSQCCKLIDSYVGTYLRSSVARSSRCLLKELNLSNPPSSEQSLASARTSHGEEKLMESLSVAPCNKIPYEPASNPVSPDPPAKRRRVEMDEDVYSDIRSLYESPNDAKMSRFREVTPLMTYAAIVRASCSSQALHHDGAALNMAFQRVAST